MEDLLLRRIKYPNCYPKLLYLFCYGVESFIVRRDNDVGGGVEIRSYTVSSPVDHK